MQGRHRFIIGSIAMLTALSAPVAAQAASGTAAVPGAYVGKAQNYYATTFTVTTTGLITNFRSGLMVYCRDYSGTHPATVAIALPPFPINPATGVFDKTLSLTPQPGLRITTRVRGDINGRVLSNGRITYSSHDTRTGYVIDCASYGPQPFVARHR